MKNSLLIKMTDEEFKLYFENKAKRYSEVLSQNIHEEGSEPKSQALNQLNRLLPLGNKTPNHYLFNIFINDNKIGYVWIKVDKEKKSAFLYEIYIFDEYRSQGFGTKVMNYIDEWLKQNEVLYFKLHVFGNNHGARKLYESLGFGIAGYNMLKSIN